MMYITHIKLKNVRCFGNVEIDLRGCKPGTSILIAGNNGIGKSAILRAIAMGLCDRDSAAALLRDLEGNFVRDPEHDRKEPSDNEHAEIEISLVDQSKKKWSIETSVLRWKEQIIERVDQTYNGNGSNAAFQKFSKFWSELFVAGYGAGLRTTATAKFTDYFAPDAVYSLFKYDTPLQDPELAWRRLRSAEEKENSQSISVNGSGADKMVRSILRYVLALPADANIILEPDGIYIEEYGAKKALDAMGDGHQALVKLTLDILVWYLLKLNYSDNKGEERDWHSLPINPDGCPDVAGIVIIDEVEQHLHPRLQRQILKRLHEKFPKIQFIISTHSPLCVSGTADVQVDGEEGYRIYSVYRNDTGDVEVMPKAVPVGLDSDQILIDYFELPTTLNVSLEDDYVRLRELLLRTSRTAEEESEFQDLQKKIAARAPVLGENVKEREFILELMRNTQAIVEHIEAQKIHDSSPKTSGA